MSKKFNKEYRYEQMEGSIGIPLVNDVFFHLLMQKCEPALKGIISGTIGIEEKAITKVEILNPIKVGDKINDKMMMLDVLVVLNDSEYIDLEMQVINYYNWPERTLNYIYRVNNDLQIGDDYKKMKNIYQIGILNFSLFKEYPEFCATYKIMNRKEPHNIYTDKLQINVIDLTHIELATEEDKQRGLDVWAKFFKSQDWRELQMLAQEKEELKEAAEIVCDFTSNDHIKRYIEQRARLDQISRETFQQRLEEIIEEKEKRILEMDKEISDKDKEISDKDKEISDKDKEISDKDKEISDKDKEILDKDKELLEKDILIEMLQAQYKELQSRLGDIE